MSITDWKNEFDNAQVGASSAYMLPGNFLMRIDNIANGANRKGVENFKVEGTIIHKIDVNGEQNVGQAVCDMYSRSSDYFAQELKGLVAGIMGKSPDEVTFDMLEKISAESQPFKGIVVEYLAYKKDPSKPFVKKYCRGIKSSKDVKNVVSEDIWNTYAPSLKFLG